MKINKTAWKIEKPSREKSRFRIPNSKSHQTTSAHLSITSPTLPTHPHIATTSPSRTSPHQPNPKERKKKKRKLTSPNVVDLGGLPLLARLLHAKYLRQQLAHLRPDGQGRARHPVGPGDGGPAEAAEPRELLDEALELLADGRVHADRRLRGDEDAPPVPVVVVVVAGLRGGRRAGRPAAGQPVGPGRTAWRLLEPGITGVCLWRGVVLIF